MSVLSSIDLCAFDMDGTLYKYTPAYIAGLWDVQARVVVELANHTLTIDEAFALCRESFAATANSWRGPARKLGIPESVIHDAYHRGIEIDHIEGLPELRDAFTGLHAGNLGIGVITHSHLHFTERVLKKLGVHDLIPTAHIVTLEQVGYREKHDDAAMFTEILDRTGADAARMLVIEDSVKNLAQARTLGAKTAYIHWGEPLAALPGHIDLQFETPVEAIRAITADA